MAIIIEELEQTINSFNDSFNWNLESHLVTLSGRQTYCRVVSKFYPSAKFGTVFKDFIN